MLFEEEYQELIKPDVDKAVREARMNDLFFYVQDGIMPLGYAASRAGQPADVFSAEMKQKGYKVPED